MDQVVECPLTPRQLDVLRRAALTNVEIAGALGLKYNTVRNHMTEISVRILGFWSPWRGSAGVRCLLLVLALRAGWISLDEVVVPTADLAADR